MFPHARIKSQKLLFFGSRDETGESGNERINGGIYYSYSILYLILRVIYYYYYYIEGVTLQ